MSFRPVQIAVDASAAVEVSVPDLGGRSDSRDMSLQLLSGTEVWVGRSSSMVAAAAAGNESWRVQAGQIFTASGLTADERIFVRCASGLTALVNVAHVGV